MAKDIHEALNEIMKEVGYVQKTSSPALRYSRGNEYVYCVDCAANGPTGESAADAIAAWNRVARQQVHP